MTPRARARRRSAARERSAQTGHSRQSPPEGQTRTGYSWSPWADATVCSMTIKLRRREAFWFVGTTLALLLFASSAPSPLYVVYQAQWHFSAITLTSVFAVYVLALLVALLFAGSLSDRVRRRPTLAAALAIELVALGLYAA